MPNVARGITSNSKQSIYYESDQPMTKDFNLKSSMRQRVQPAAQVLSNLLPWQLNTVVKKHLCL